MSEDPDHLLQVLALRTNGAFLPVPEKALRLEFIGDSITSGEGAIGAREEEDWVAMLFSAENDYAVMTGDRMDADVRLLSQSGWGVLTAWDNNSPRSVPLPAMRRCAVCCPASGMQTWEHTKSMTLSLAAPCGHHKSGYKRLRRLSSPRVEGRGFRRDLPAAPGRRQLCPEDLRRFQLAVIAFCGSCA